MLVDAQDIDALLIGALYGELTPADEARLAAHLESHPTDRTALDDLTHARSVVRESRIFEVQSEPPQAVSALLLQEAARRAPKRVAVPSESESWFHRFVRSFMSHPAMAAAAMIVVVVGVAGTLYMRHGEDQFANEQAPTLALDEGRAAGEYERQAKPADVPSTGAAMGSAAAGASGAGSGSAFGADLAGDQFRGNTRGASEDKKDVYYKDKDVARDHVAPTHSTSTHDGLVVRTPPTPTPREMPATPLAKNDVTPKVSIADDQERKQEVAVAPGAAAPTDPNAGYAKAPVAASPPPPATVATTPQVAQQQHGRNMDNNNVGASASGAATADATLVAWAKDQHVRVQALAKAGKCQDAAKIALDISTRAPDYYAANVASDRMLKACQTYINDARDKEAEKSQKARAAKRVNANEPAPATDSLK